MNKIVIISTDPSSAIAAYRLATGKSLIEACLWLCGKGDRPCGVVLQNVVDTERVLTYMTRNCPKVEFKVIPQEEPYNNVFSTIHAERWLSEIAPIVDRLNALGEDYKKHGRYLTDIDQEIERWEMMF